MARVPADPAVSAPVRGEAAPGADAAAADTTATDPTRPDPTDPTPGADPTSTAPHGTAGARARLTYQPALDGVRGIGLFFVLASHNGFDWARGGFLWVSSFFTLSGYLITSLLIAEHRRFGSISARAFWSRRFRRLMPAAIVTLLLVVGFGAVFADASQLSRLRGDGLAALFYVANWRFIFTHTSYADLFASPSPVQHFWTLSIEEQFYIAFPVIIVATTALGRGRWRTVAVVVGALTAASVGWMLYLSATGADIDRLYFGTDTRLPELTMGVLLAIALSRWDPSARPWSARLVEIVGLAALATIVVLTFTVERTDAVLYRGGFTAYAIVSCLLVTAAIQPGSITRRFLSFKPLVALGLLSYAAYLFHWPLYLVLDADRLHLGLTKLFAVRFTATIAVAWLVYRFVEQPIRSGHRIVGRNAVIAVPLAFALVSGGLVAVTIDPPPVEVNLAGDDQVDPPPVAPGAARIMIVGDSQAWVLGNALRRWSEAHPTDAAVWNAAGRGCGIVRGGEANRLGQVTTGICEDWETRWANQLARFDPDVIVVLSGGWDWVERKLPEWDRFRSYGDPVFDAHMLAEYREAARVLSSEGASVVWFTNPCYELEGFGKDPRPSNTQILPAVVAAHPEVEVYDFFADLCPSGAFTRELGGFRDARPDGVHLSEPAADWVASWLMPRLIQRAR